MYNSAVSDTAHSTINLDVQYDRGVSLSFSPNPRARECTFVYRKLETETWEIQSVTHSYLTMGKTVQGGDIHSSPNMTHPLCLLSCPLSPVCLLYLSIPSLYELLASLHFSSLLEISIKSLQQRRPATAAWLPRVLLTDQEDNSPHPTTTTTTTTSVTQSTHSCNQDKTVRLP